jgi:hypothetical protein
MYKLDLDKLAKVLGMMGSDHDGEVMAAARMAIKMVKDANTTWHEVLGPKASASPSPFDFWPQQPQRPQRPERPRYDNRWEPEDEDDHRTGSTAVYFFMSANRTSSARSWTGTVR